MAPRKFSSNILGNFLDQFLVVKVANQASNGSRCQVLAAPENTKALSKQVPKEYKAHFQLLNDLKKSGELSSAAGSTCLVRNGGEQADSAKHVLFLGLGSDKTGINQLGPHERLRRLGAALYKKLEQEKIGAASIWMDTFYTSSAKLNLSADQMAASFVEGFGLAAYRFDYYKTNPNTHKGFQLEIISSNARKQAAYDNGVKTALSMLKGAFICRDLSNEPSNSLYPEAFAYAAKNIASTFHLKSRALTEKELKKERMELLLGVGRGSQHPPRLIVLEYVPQQKKGKKELPLVALVGKGVTFDSGGISIKPSARMEEMKHDMSGAAAVVGAMVSVAELKPNCRVIAVVAAAENMPDGKALCPGHILKARSGKTVEVNNTDAEGRLVLADALDWVQDLEPDYIIDIATLTGAATITLGKVCAGLMSNSDALTRHLKQAAKISGERLWELPLFDEYFDDLKSEHADMRNSGDTASHGTAKGAMFLKQFIRSNTKWAHLDIASVAMGVSSPAYNPRKGGTGYGVRLLVELLKGI